MNAEKENVEFLLSYDEICGLLNEANIQSSDWGFTGNNFVLARYNDAGPYKIGNCRFITQFENNAEKKFSEASLKASQRNIKTAFEKLNSNAEALERREISLKFYQQKRKQDAELRHEELDKLKHPSYKGEGNSQFGTRWITEGTLNRKISKDDLVPEGWKYGRTKVFLNRV